MTTSADSCFAAGSGLLPLDDALELIAARIAPVAEETETVPLGAALGRVLAEDVHATITNPGFAASAMDGFAVGRAGLDGNGPWTLPVVARIAAGHPYTGTVPAGAAVEIFTGAPLPAGVDSVVMVEDTTTTGSGGERTVTLPAGLRAGSHVRPAGEDFTAGDLLLRAGRRLRPQEVHLAGTTGRATLNVRRRLRVGVFSTGDEVVEPGRPLVHGQVYGGNRYGQMAVISALGHQAVDLGHLPDDPAVIRAALLAAAADHDALLTSGGVSVGGEDHVRAVLETIGTLHLWRLALKPGKPVTLGTIPGGDRRECVFLGMPGYPVSAMVTTLLVARAVLARLAGAVAEPLLPQAIPVPAAFSYARKHGRREFLRASLSVGENGALGLSLYPRQGSGVVNSLAHSDGLADLRESTGAVAPGDPVPFLPYASLLW